MEGPSPEGCQEDADAQPLAWLRVKRVRVLRQHHNVIHQGKFIHCLLSARRAHSLPRFPEQGFATEEQARAHH